MKKQIQILLLCAALLVGCAEENVPNVSAPTGESLPVAEPTAPTEPERDIYAGETHTALGTAAPGTVALLKNMNSWEWAHLPKTLADCFYEDVNYIDFINSNIAQQVDILGESWVYTAWTYLKRPFTGIPADYPHWELYGSYLEIAFPVGNPFFHSRMEVRFSVELNGEVSPYHYQPTAVHEWLGAQVVIVQQPKRTEEGLFYTLPVTGRVGVDALLEQCFNELLRQEAFLELARAHQREWGVAFRHHTVQRGRFMTSAIYFGPDRFPLGQGNENWGEGVDQEPMIPHTVLVVDVEAKALSGTAELWRWWLREKNEQDLREHFAEIIGMEPSQTFTIEHIWLQDSVFINFVLRDEEGALHQFMQFG